jgi:hypothetical protein
MLRSMDTADSVLRTPDRQNGPSWRLARSFLGSGSIGFLLLPHKEDAPVSLVLRAARRPPRAPASHAQHYFLS